MGKKGARRKTRWRTLSIGTPPGEEDDEEGVRNGYGEGDQKDSGKEHNGSTWLKFRHGSAGSSSNGSGNGSSTNSGYASSGSRSQRGYGSSGGGSRSYPSYSSNGSGSQRSYSSESSPQQPKVIFDENEYTRITTPRSDMLFKKDYLIQKFWKKSSSSMSATPESQSASQSVADDSEVVVSPQVTYSRFYDDRTGYYYEYPMVMMMAPMMPYVPVPLRPLEWVNPVYIPKMGSQQYCYMEHQTMPGSDCAVVVDAEGVPISVVEGVPPTNGLSNETSLTGSVSASASPSVSGSVADEPFVVCDSQLLTQPEHMPPQMLDPEQEHDLQFEEPMEQPEMLEFMDPVVETLPPQAMHLTHVIPQPMGQPYIYPGQYMFGSPLIEENVMPDFFLDEGVTIQNGPMLRCNDAITSVATAACTKLCRRKKKKRKQKRPHALDNTEDDDAEDYSSEDESNISSSRVSWSGTTNGIATCSLNPECQEFHLRSSVECTLPTNILNSNAIEFTPHSNSTSTSISMAMESIDENTTSVAGYDCTASTEDHISRTCKSPMLKKDMDNEPKRLNDNDGMPPTCDNSDHEDISSNNIDNASMLEKKNCHQILSNGDYDECQRTSQTVGNGYEPQHMLNGNDLPSKPSIPEINGTINSHNADSQLSENYESIKTRSNGVAVSKNSSSCKRKCSLKTSKFVREPTPGPISDDPGTIIVDDPSQTNAMLDKRRNEESSLDDITSILNSTSIEVQSSQKDAELNIGQTWVNESSITSESYNENNETTITSMRLAADEDSGFESQSKLGFSERPITEAVTEWIKKANSPDLFIVSPESESSEDDEDDEDSDASMNNKPSKNLQSNPMPALSANKVAYERESTRGKFANSTDRIEGVVYEVTKITEKGSLKNHRNIRSVKRKCTKSRTRKSEDLLSEDNREKNHVLAQENIEFSVEIPQVLSDCKIDEVCKFTGKDSDAGMRVAKKSRINMRVLDDSANFGDNIIDVKICRVQEEMCKNKHIGDMLSVKTYEKGEIVVSMDGELLHVVPVLQENKEKDQSWSIERKINNCAVEEESERSLGSIEEPDVLECWEAETVEPVLTHKKIQGQLAEEEFLVVEDNVCDRINHVQKYYRLQADSSVTSVEDDIMSDNINFIDNLDTSKAIIVPNTFDEATESICSIDRTAVIMPEEKSKSTGEDISKLPVDEAFEVYESCYTSKPLRFTSIDQKFGKSLFFDRNTEGPIPCRAVCCNIQ